MSGFFVGPILSHSSIGIQSFSRVRNFGNLRLLVESSFPSIEIQWVLQITALFFKKMGQIIMGQF